MSAPVNPTEGWGPGPKGHPWVVAQKGDLGIAAVDGIFRIVQVSRTNPAATRTAYAPVREGERGPWIHTMEIRVLLEEAIAAGEEMDRLIPGWAKEHPVIRVARVEIREVCA